MLRTGGSSLIPAVKDILDNQFAGKVVEHDPFTSVAAGLAIADYYQYAEADPLIMQPNHLLLFGLDNLLACNKQDY